jgi:hypothetical protein
MSHENFIMILICYVCVYIYIYRERESDYGVLQSTETLCVLHSIFNFKSEIIDLNRSI